MQGPNFFTQSVHNLASHLRMAKVGRHSLWAEVNFEGRNWNWKRPVDNWSTVTIGGKPLQALNAEELTARNWQPKVGDKMFEHLEKHCNQVFEAASWMNEASILEEMQQYIWDVEMKAIQQMRTWDFARRIICT